ncbi:hypothetical protein JCM10207_007361 [Rhodosporidiobolus poonsookiae]
MFAWILSWWIIREFFDRNSRVWQLASRGDEIDWDGVLRQLLWLQIALLLAARAYHSGHIGWYNRWMRNDRICSWILRVTGVDLVFGPMIRDLLSPLGRAVQRTTIGSLIRQAFQAPCLRPLADAICVMGRLVMIPLSVSVLIAVGCCELIFYVSFLSYLAAIWGVIYYEIAKAGMRRMCRNKPSMWGSNLKRLAHRHIDTANSVSWEQLPDDFATPARNSIARACEPILEERPNTTLLYSTSFKLTIYEMAGIFARCLLPLPCLKHLFRPFRFGVFLPFLMTYPGFRLCIRPFGSLNGFSNAKPALDVPPLSSFEIAVFSFVEAAHQDGLGARQAANALYAHLRFYTTYRAAVEAESRAHDAIPDAVLVWKAHKLELKRARRNKQD